MGLDGRRFGICPLPRERVYFYCTAPLGKWQGTVRDHLEEWIEGWRGFGPEVLAVLRAVPDWERVLYDELHEVVLNRWYRVPAFIVGDAAHAMTPNLGQGANCAMVDALVLMRLLARALKSGESLDAVGRTYESLRRPFVTRIQREARRLGVLAGWSAAPARLLRNAILSLAPMAGPLMRRSMLVTAGYNPAEEPYFRLVEPEVL